MCENEHWDEEQNSGCENLMQIFNDTGYEWCSKALQLTNQVWDFSKIIFVE